MTAVASIVALVAVATFTTSLGTPMTRAEEPSPSEPGPSNSLPPVECTGSGSEGPLPSGSQAISGTVSFAGSPVGGLTVYLGELGNGLATSTETNPLGEYQFLDLGNASYTVAFSDGAGGYVDGFWDGATAPPVIDPAAATPIALSGAGASGVDAALQLDTPRSITGTVTDHLLNPVSGAEVRASGRYFGGLVGCASAESGTFAMTNLDSGLYVLRVSAPSYPVGYYKAGAPGNFTSDPTDASVITVDADVSGIDIAFPELVSLTGYVRNAADEPIAGFSIFASEVGGGADGFAGSDETGFFEISGLLPGDYHVSYSDGYLVHRSGWYAGDGVPGASSDADAAIVSLPGPAIQLLAEPAPTMTGRITDTNGDPVSSTYLSICDESQEVCAYSQGTDGNGEFTATVFTEATYYVQVYPDPWATGFQYPAGGYITSLGGPIAPGFDSALGIAAGASDLTGIDGVLPFGGRIEASLTSGGAHVDGPYPTFCREGPVECGYDTFEWDSDLDALSGPLFPGTYYVKEDIDYDGIEHWLVDGGIAVEDFAGATPVVVTAGNLSTITSDIPVPGTPTPTGDSDVTVDDGNGTSLEMSFVGVDEGGTTTATSSDFGPTPPAGFQLGVPATYWDISTTATGFESVTICIPYGGLSWIAEANLRLFHFDADTDAWEDITDPGYPDLGTQTICGTTDSLSPFVLAERSMAFTGFFQPVDNGVLNKAKAGSGVPVKFSLGGDFGLDIFAAGSPSVSTISCTSSAVDAIEQTVSVGSSHLVYDAAADQYVYLFKTSKDWAGTCRRLTLEFADGTIRSADFKFVR